MRGINAFLRFFFSHLYTTWAWSYDWVAWVVSLGQWGKWTQAVIPYLTDSPVLELGYGPGHLQKHLLSQGTCCYGIDSSPQMAQLVKGSLRKLKLQPMIVRGKVQRLPFASKSMGTVFATFPTEFIVDLQTLKEVWRVLKDQGSLLIVFMAEVTGTNMLDRFIRWLFRFTGESKDWDPKWLEPFYEQGFIAQLEQVEFERSLVMMIRAQKRSQNPVLNTQG